jgi:hypothetical protein
MYGSAHKNRSAGIINTQFRKPWPRSVIDIGALDLKLQEQILTLGSLKDFHILLWQHEPDASGCNWNASIERVKERLSAPPIGDQLIPRLRTLFNLG